MSESTDEEALDAKWELRFGLTLAVFAAVLAINNLGAGKFGEDELKETNEKASSYMWYQSKGIKESLAEGQRDLIRALLKAGAISMEKVAELEKVADQLDVEAKRYKGEKKEILLGSVAVGQENWAQEVDGKLGQVIGSKQREETIAKLSDAGDVFDIATLCLELCMVLGAIGLLLKIPQSRKVMFATVLVLGCLGILFCARAYSMILM